MKAASGNRNEFFYRIKSLMIRRFSYLKYSSHLVPFSNLSEKIKLEQKNFEKNKEEKYMFIRNILFLVRQDLDIRRVIEIDFHPNCGLRT